MKRCYKCKIEKDVSEFAKCARKKDGLQGMCKVCQKSYHKKHYQANHDNVREIIQKWKEANPDKKRCPKCGIEKDKSEFYKDARSKDGLHGQCKICDYTNNQKWVKANPDKVKEQYGRRKALRKANPERAKKDSEHSKKWRKANPERERALTKKWRKANPDKVKEMQKEADEKYKKAHPDKVKEIIRKVNQKKLSTPMGKLNAYMSHYIYQSLKGGKNGYHWVGLVGYDEEELMIHIESQWQPEMTWENYGARHKKGFRTWVVDHTIPVAFFHFTSPDDPEFKACWALSNLRPMWEDENLSKGDKLSNGLLGRHIRAQKIKAAKAKKLKTTFPLDLSKSKF